MVPVFAAEADGVDQGTIKFRKFDYGGDFPDVPHLRGETGNRILESLR